MEELGPQLALAAGKVGAAAVGCRSSISGALAVQTRAESDARARTELEVVLAVVVDRWRLALDAAVAVADDVDDDADWATPRHHQRWQQQWERNLAAQLCIVARLSDHYRTRPVVVPFGGGFVGAAAAAVGDGGGWSFVALSLESPS